MTKNKNPKPEQGKENNQIQQGSNIKPQQPALDPQILINILIKRDIQVELLQNQVQMANGQIQGLQSQLDQMTKKEGKGEKKT